jgi:hypothetical protein
MMRKGYAAVAIAIFAILASIIAYSAISIPHSSSFYSKLTPDDLDFI